MTDRRPGLEVESAPFWAACAAGRLEAQRCAACGHLRFPPSPTCPDCLGSEAAWEELSGRGEVLTYVVFHRGYHPAWVDRVPYNVVLVQMEEGPRMVSNVVDDEPSVGLAVTVAFTERDGRVVPVFRRAAGALPIPPDPGAGGQDHGTTGGG